MQMRLAVHSSSMTYIVWKRDSSLLNTPVEIRSPLFVNRSEDQAAVHGMIRDPPS